MLKTDPKRLKKVLRRYIGPFKWKFSVTNVKAILKQMSAREIDQVQEFIVTSRCKVIVERRYRENGDRIGTVRREKCGKVNCQEHRRAG